MMTMQLQYGSQLKPLMWLFLVPEKTGRSNGGGHLCRLEWIQEEGGPSLRLEAPNQGGPKEVCVHVCVCLGGGGVPHKFSVKWAWNNGPIP